MKRILRLAAPLLFVLSASSLATTVTLDPPTSWTKSDVPADPSVTFGTLPNGMRYLIKHNENPTHGVSVVLRIAAGSFDETPKQAGLSHFVEHMGFRGSRHIADGEAIKMLQTIGVGFGTDSNAVTGTDSTVYYFDLPGNSAQDLDTAFTLMRDIASEVTFDPKAVDSERQVVLAEYRLRDTPVLHMARAGLDAQFGERLAEAYLPIGSQAMIGAASAEDLKAYYKAHYRPERAVLMVVGDVDVKVLEADIKTRFSDWKSAEAKPAPPRFTYPDPLKQPQFKLFVENGANAVVQMSWVSPFDPTPETRARDERETVRRIALHVLNMRLRELATSTNPPFLGAGAGASNSHRTAYVASLSASVGSGDAGKALKALRQTLLIALRDGVSQDEVNRAVAQQRTHLTADITAAKSRKNNQWTGSFLPQLGTSDVIDGPENWLPTFEGGVKDLKAARVTAVLKELYATHEPLVFVSSPTPLSGGEEAIAAAYTDAANLPAPSAVAHQAPVLWPYTDFGPAGTVAKQQSIADLGTTFVTFANGVRATIKPTKFQEGQVEIEVRFGHGRLAMPSDKIQPRWAVTGALSGGGFGRLSNADLPKALAGKQVGATPGIGDSAFLLSGKTRTTDFETEMQLCTAILTDPAWRPEGLRQTQSATLTALAQAGTTASGSLALHLGAITHNNDKRWLPPTADAVKAVELEPVKAMIQPALASGPVEVVVVGDITVDEAVAALKKTFGAIAKREIETKPIAGHEELPKAGSAPVVLRYQGKSEEASAVLAWKTAGLFPDIQLPRTLAVLRAIVKQRLFDELRTKEGITYGPQVQTPHSWYSPEWGYFAVKAEIPSTKLAAFYAAAKKVANDLKTTDVPTDEFERARGPLVKDAEHAEQTNGYWLEELAGVQVEPRALEVIRTHVSAYKAVTPADVRRAAQTYLKDERSFRVIAVPEGFAVPDTLP